LAMIESKKKNVKKILKRGVGEIVEQRTKRWRAEDEKRFIAPLYL